MRWLSLNYSDGQSLDRTYEELKHLDPEPSGLPFQRLDRTYEELKLTSSL